MEEEENKFYYIALFKKFLSMEDNSRNGFSIEKLNGKKTALMLIEETYKGLEPDSGIFFLCQDYEPFLISNNPVLNKKYRNVFSEEEFKAYCIYSSMFGNEIEKLSLENQIIAIRSNCNAGKALYEHFQNIIKGKYSKAYMYEKVDTHIEEDTGYQYDVPTESGWKTE